MASNEYLQKIRSNAKQVIGDADLVVYMAHDKTSSVGTIGTAWSPVVCESSEYNSQKTSINEWRPDSVAYGGVSTKNFISIMISIFFYSISRQLSKDCFINVVDTYSIILVTGS